MVYQQEDDHLRLLNERTREAIALAMESRWKEAAAVNRKLTEAAPADIDAWNRLGKALLELGDANGARHAFGKTLEIEPGNAIARKNVERLSDLPAKQQAAAKKRGSTQLAPRLFFINDGGKTAHVTLVACARGKDRPLISPGAPVRLEQCGDSLAVHTEQGVQLGLVPPKLGRRLSRLMDGGNDYRGAIASITPDSIKIVLRETYQHPSQRSTVSFPSSAVTPEAPPVERAGGNGAGNGADPAIASRDVQQWSSDETDGAPKMAPAAVGAVLDGGMPDDSMLPELPED